MRPYVKCIAGFLLLICCRDAVASVFADRLAINLVGVADSRKWNVDQATTSIGYPSYGATTNSSYSLEAATIGGGGSASLETTRPGISLGVCGGAYFSRTNKLSATAHDLSGAAQWNIGMYYLGEVNYKIAAIAPFAATGFGIIYSSAVSGGGSSTTPNHSYLFFPFAVGGGLKIFMGENLYARGTFLYEFYQLGVDLSSFGSSSQTTTKHSLSRDIQSGFSVQIGVGYILDLRPLQ